MQPWALGQVTGSPQHRLDRQFDAHQVQFDALIVELLAQATKGLHTRGINPVDGVRDQHHMARARVGGDVFGHRALKAVGGGEIERSVHAQRAEVGRQRRQQPQVAVAQAAIGMQADLDDAGVQPQVQKVRKRHQHARKHAPVEARRGQQRHGEGGPRNARLNA